MLPFFVNLMQVSILVASTTCRTSHGRGLYQKIVTPDFGSR